MQNASGSIPHPLGNIAASYHYNRDSKKSAVTINLPALVSGVLVWKGKGYNLSGDETPLEVE